MEQSLHSALASIVSKIAQGDYSFDAGIFGGDREIVESLAAIIERCREFPALKKRIVEISDNFFWQSEELKARNEEIEAYANVLLKQKERLEESNRQLLESQVKEREAFLRLTSKEESLRKSQTELLCAKDQAETASRAKTEFLATMSHEIRTPMNSVIGFGDLLKRSNLNAQQREYVEAICESGEQLIALLDEILDISKIESGKIALEKVDFDLELLIVNVLRIMRQKVGTKPLELTLAYPGELPNHFKGDPTRIRQIFLNLVGNAVKFTDRGDVVVEVSLDGDGAAEVNAETKLRISVIDTGIGIAADKQEVIFREFTQANPEIGRKYGGNGLGLTITRTLVEMMGGTIRVVSELGGGSEFIFTLPLCKGTARTDSGDALSESDRVRGKCVLLADDNVRSREIIKRQCETIGMIVSCAADNAAAALSWLKNAPHPPDVVLADIMMPDMDGFQFVKKIRRVGGMKGVEIIALVPEAVSMEPFVNAASDVHGYLVKPFTRNELYDVLGASMQEKKTEKGRIAAGLKDNKSSVKNVKVLLAEDNHLNQKLMIILLNQMGCSVEVVNNGHEAVLKAAGGDYDVILMDIQMPLMNGLEATELLRNQMKINTPIIALTARVFKEDDEKCMAAGMNDFLTKPVDISALKGKILKWVRN